MSIVFIILTIARGAFVLALGLLLVRLLARSSAALRSLVLAATLLATAALPVFHLLAPSSVTHRLSSAARELVRAPVAPVAEPEGLAVTSAPTNAEGTATTHAPRSIAWGAIALAAWALGALGIGARAAVGALRARRLVRRGAPGTAPMLLATWYALGGRGEPPPIIVSDELEAPIVAGTFAPAVVVPTRSKHWTNERWRVVLLHELAHVRRRDGLTQLFAHLACALHWINPLVWIAARQLRAEREHAADDAVLRAGTRASTYAEHLVEIAAGQPVAFAALAMAEPSRFEARVVALFDDRSRRAAGARTASLVCAGLGAIAALSACMSPDAGAARPAAAAPMGSPVAMGANDPAFQATLEAELGRSVTDFKGTGGLVVVLDAKTGGIVALASRGGLDVRTPRVNGSTMKPFTVAAALEAGIATPATTIDCDQGTRMYGDKKMSDSAAHGVLDLGEILAVSSNVCTAKLAEPLGDRLGEALRRFHLPAPEHIDTRTFAGATLAAGEGSLTTPLALASAYTAFANEGVYRGLDGHAERVMSVGTAQAVHAMLDRVVNTAAGTGQAAAVAGVRVIGKTGTAETSVPERYYASFIGIVPADAPRYVILVGVDGTTSYGGAAAAPLFAKLATAALAR